MGVLARQFAEAVWPDRWTVLGVRLQPMSIGHALLLHRLGNGFAPYGREGGKEAGLSDLVLAVYVCSLPAGTAAARLEGGMPWKLRWWLWSLTWMTTRGTLPVLGVATQIGQMRSYVAAQATGPRAWIKKSEGRPYGAPFLAQVVATLLADLGVGWESALGMPLGLALWLCETRWEANGQLELATEDESADALGLAADGDGHGDSEGKDGQAAQPGAEHQCQDAGGDARQAEHESVGQDLQGGDEAAHGDGIARDGGPVDCK